MPCQPQQKILINPQGIIIDFDGTKNEHIHAPV